MRKLWLFLPIALATAFAAPQTSAAPLYTAVLGNGCVGAAGVGTINSSTPVTASVQCSVPTVITEKGNAGSSAGHVGASWHVDSGICCHSDAISHAHSDSEDTLLRTLSRRWPRCHHAKTIGLSGC